jgi:spermidine synthase
MKRRIRVAILAMGFSGLVAEILLLRELLIVFSGNELCIGVILANWLILEAAGSLLFGRKAGRSKNGLETYAVITVVFCLSLLLATLLTRNLRRVLGVSIGQSIGLLPMLVSSMLILLPAGVLHGAQFTLGCRIYARFLGDDASAAGRVYVHETVGTIIGGIACTYLLVPYLHTFQAFSGLALLNTAVCVALIAPYWRTGPYQKAILVVLSVLTFFSAYWVFGGQADRLHQHSIRAQWRHHNVVHYQNSKYGNICIIENEGQYTYFLDGVPDLMTPIPDIPFIEESVHLPLLAHPEPARLLVLSGGAGGVISEALRHPSIETIEYAELDPLLLDLMRRFPTPLTESELNDSRVRTRHIDGRLLLKTVEDEYDLILVGIDEPSSLQTNRFFTREFFSLAKNRLSEAGILVLGLPGSLTYLDEGLRDLNSCIFNTLRSVFPYVRAIPGDGRNLFLSSASQGISTIDTMRITERLDQRKIGTEVIVPWHIGRKLHPGWQDWFSRLLDQSSQRTNSDFSPIGLFYSISHWNALYAPSLRWTFAQLERANLGTVVLLFALLLLLYLCLRSRKIRFLRAGIPLSILTTGFAGMMFDLMLIFAFQSVYGYVFSWIGLLVAAFMAGAASGAMLITAALERIEKPHRLFVRLDLALICASIGWPFILLAIHAYVDSPLEFTLFRILFLIISFLCGLLVGSQFPLANRICLANSSSVSKTSGLLYAADLLGGWFGGIVGAVVLLPVFGLIGACITVGLLKLTSFIVLTTQPERGS